MHFPRLYRNSRQKSFALNRGIFQICPAPMTYSLLLRQVNFPTTGNLGSFAAFAENKCIDPVGGNVFKASLS